MYTNEFHVEERADHSGGQKAMELKKDSSKKEENVQASTQLIHVVWKRKLQFQVLIDYVGSSNNYLAVFQQ